MKMAYWASSIIFILFTIGVASGDMWVNFTVIYNELATDEIVRLQNAIEDTQLLGDLKVVPLSISSPDVPEAPVNVSTKSLSESAIYVKWNSVNSVDGKYNILGYAVFYKRWGEQIDEWERIATGSGVTQVNLTDLLSYKVYTIRVLAFYSGGNGIASTFVDEQTMEGRPGKAPQNLACVSNDPKEITLEWTPLETNDWNGLPYKYRAYYRVFGSFENRKTIEFDRNQEFGTISGLVAFTAYEILFTAMTKRGFGPVAWCQPTKTMEGVPDVGPVITSWELDPIQQNEAYVEWNPIPKEYRNGKLLEYKVQYGLFKEGEETVAYPNYTTIRTGDPYTTAVSIKNIPTDVIMAVRVAGVTRMGDGKYSDATYIESCKCPKYVYCSWFSNSPYVSGIGRGQVKGIFPVYLQKMVDELCKNCKGLKQQSGSHTTLYWDRSKDGRSPRRANEMDLKQSVDDNIHMHVAIYRRAELIRFRDKYKFIPIVNSPGIAFVIRDPLAELDKTAAIMDSLFSCWPAIIVIFVFSLLAGILIWVLDCESNAQEFPSEHFFTGIYHGAYWAFISMSTVGYGDKTPRSFIAKFVTIAWMLLGPVINGVVIGAMTTSMTTITLEKEAKLYGTKVAAINGTFEYNLGVRRNAIMDSSNYEYKTPEDLIEALEYRDVDGILMDALVAADRYDVILKKKMKISKLIDERSGWGIILSSDFIKLEKDIRDYVIDLEKETEDFVKNYTKGKLEIKAAAPESLDTGIVDPESKTFKEFMKSCGIILILACVFGLFYDVYFLRKRRNRIKPQGKICHDMLVNDVFGLVEAFCDEVTVNINQLATNHESELKKFCWKKGYSFGIDGWLRQKTSDETELKKDIRYQEIMLQDLILHKTQPAHDLHKLKYKSAFLEAFQRSDEQTSKE